MIIHVQHVLKKKNVLIVQKQKTNVLHVRMDGIQKEVIVLNVVKWKDVLHVNKQRKHVQVVQ